MPYGSPADIPLDSESWLEGQGWYKTFRKELDNTLRWKEYSMLECPAIVMLVSTTTEPSLDVISCFHELSHPRHLPPPYSTGHYDESTVVYHYLLLHDEHRASKTSQRICDPYTVFAAMKENFPPDQCSFVPINGLQQGSENLSQPNVQWNICDELQYSGQEQVVHGAYLNSDNLSRLRKFGQELTCRHVLKSMEKRIAVLMPVANTVQNRVKSLVKSWWRKPKEGIPESGNSKGTVMYPFNSVVSQTRLLADTTLIMRDFESALSMYRAAAHQFKGDRSYLYYAAASFGAALATMMIQHSGGGSPNRVEIYMLNAEEACSHARSELLSQYDSSMQLLPAVPKFTLHLSPMPRAPIPLATRLGTQIALLHSDYLASRGLHVEAGAALVRNASNEPNLTGGVLLEKAAWHFLKGKCLRQFAFHCIMAAHVYRAAGLHVHALHCYSFALDVYEDSMWFAPKAHIHSILAYELSSMGKIQTAIIMFVRLFAGLNHDNHYCTRIEEADILTAFLNLCSMHPGAAKAASAVLAQRKGGGGVINMIIADCKENVVESSGDHLTNNEEVAFENFPLPFISDSELIVMDGSEEGEGGKGMGASDLCTSLQIGGEVDHEILQSISSPGSLAEIMCMRDELWDECKVMSSVGNRHKDGTMMTVADELAQSHRGDPYARQRNPMKPNAAWRAMGEPLSLHVVLKNPLIVPLVLESVQLTAKLMLCDAPELVTLGDPTNGSSADELQLFTAQALSQTQFDEVLQQWVNSHGKPKIRQQESDHVNNNTDPNRMVVVDDVNVTLPPTSKVSVRLRVCPLRKGLLKIDGVQWRLIKPPHDGSSSPSTVCVVGRHSFNLEGPLIHDTIEHREMRMRAPCKMLHSAVVGAMPCLICTVSGIDSTLLQGEMVSARLRVQNIGPAPAGNLLLKSNVAWLSLDEFQPESDGDCNRGSADSIPGLQHDGSSSNIGNRFTDGVSYAVGGSGTLFAPPVGPLMPGDVVELPMRIRPPEGGKHILVLLLRYKCWVPSAPNEPPSTCAGTEEDEEVKELYGRGIGCTDHFERFSYTSVGLTILPSMCALVSVSPSYATPGEYILGVEISNSRTNYDSNRIAGEDLRLYVPRVCSVSCGWRMEPLRAVDAISGEQTRCVEGAVCEWQERIMLHYRLIPVSYSTVPDGWQSLDGLPPHGCNVPLIHSDCHWDSAGTPQAVHGLDAASTQSPCLQLLCLEHAAAKFHSAKETYLRQAAAKETAGMNHPMTIQSIRRQNVQSKALETLKHVSVSTTRIHSHQLFYSLFFTFSVV